MEFIQNKHHSRLVQFQNRIQELPNSSPTPKQGDIGQSDIGVQVMMYFKPKVGMETGHNLI